MSSATPTHDYTARARLFGGNRMKLGVMAFNCSHGSTITTVPEAWKLNWPDTKDIAQAAECFHGVNVKLVKTGGISGGFDALRAARKAGLKTMIGCMIETSILISAAAHLAELCDYLDVDGNILITNDPYVGVKNENGILSFAAAPEKVGLRVSAKQGAGE